jgi:uncharacterized Zn finger protein
MSYFDQPRREKRRSFGLTWWGNEWVQAIESSASLDANRLPRGRTYARWGYVGDLDINPGVVTAPVEGSDPQPYRTFVKVKTLNDNQWEQLFDVVASKVGHAASLIDGELSSELVDDATAIGISLLPANDEITTGCSCPDDAEPCKHAAAVCYLIADILDDNPFELLHLRGRSQEDVVASLRSRRQRSEVLPPNEVAASEIAGRTPLPLPKIPRPPAKSPEVIAGVAEFARDHDLDKDDLGALAVAGARRCWEITTGIGDSGLRANPYPDLVRHAAVSWGTPEFKKLCKRTGVDTATLQQDIEEYLAPGFGSDTSSDD